MLIVQIKCEVSLSIYVTAIPIAISLFTSILSYLAMIKRRKKFINKINDQSVEVLRNKQWVTLKWKDILVGDLIKLNNGEIAPADIILLQTSDLQSTSVETVLIDGSSQLTPRAAPNLIDLTFEGALANTPFEISDMKRELYSDNVNIKNPLTTNFIFSGFLDFNGRSVDLSNINYIERYSIIHHNKFIIGGVVYSGHDCMTVNQRLFKTRPNYMERLLNTLNLIQVSAILLFSVIMSLKSFDYFNVTRYWPFNEDLSQYTFFMHNLRNYLILLLPLTPLELYSFIDLAVLFNSNVIKHLFKKTCVPNPYALNDLANADVLMTSKMNLLEPKPSLKRIFISDQIYGKEPTIRKLCETKQLNIKEANTTFGQFSDPDLEGTSEDTRTLFLHLSLCHSATLVGVRGKFSYVSRFPDDEQLLRLAANSGYMLVARTPDESVILIGDSTYSFKTKRIIHSSSNHPRISIIVEDGEGSIILFTRGVFKVMEPIVDGIDKYKSIYDTFHDDGLHVECCSYRYLTQKQYKRFEEKLLEFGNENVDFTFSIVDNLENHSTFLSIIGFEDQPREGVLSFLDCAKHAFKQIILTSTQKGNSVVITGISLGIIKNNPEVGLVKGYLLDDVDISITYLIEKQNYDVLIIDGGAVEFLTQTQYAYKIAEMIQKTRVIVLQKADTYQTAAFTRYMQIVLNRTLLGLGSTVYDSAYMHECDCSISICSGDLHVSDVSADIITSNFNDLTELVFVHGCYIRDRIKQLVNSVFSRNIIFATLQFWFILETGCSATPLFSEPVILSLLYIFTFLPFLSYSIANRKFIADDLLGDPKFFRRTNHQIVSQSKLILYDIFYSSFSFMILFLAKKTTMNNNPQIFSSTLSLKTFSFQMSLVFVVIVLAMIVSNSDTWTLLHHFFIWGSLFFFLVTYFIGTFYGQSRGSVLITLSSPSSLAFVLFSFICSMFVEFTIRFIKQRQPRSHYRTIDCSDDEITDIGDKNDILFENVEEF